MWTLSPLFVIFASARIKKSYVCTFRVNVTLAQNLSKINDLRSKLGHVGVMLALCWPILAQLGPKFGQSWRQVEASWAKMTEMEVKKAKIGQHGPKLKPRSSKSTEHC